MTEKLDVAPLRGMRDFTPVDWVFRKKLLEAFDKASTKTGFLRYETPVVDSYELFERKAGEELSDQIYEFRDKSDRHLALRPEITPTMVRLYMGLKESLPFPAKIWSFGQCFRYERPTKGRYREHFQWNIDIMGEADVSAEAWILFTAVEVMKELGFDAKDYQIRVSSRALLSGFLLKIGVTHERHAALMTLIDKKEKVDAGWLKEEMAALGLTTEQIERLFTLLETHDAAEIGNLVGSENVDYQNLQKLFRFAEALGYREYLQMDPSIIRGLSYYTGIVFEAFDTQRQFRALFGGGRYDALFSRMTGKDIPACGLGFGDGVIRELYTAKFGYPETYEGVDMIVGYYDESLQKPAMEFVQKAIELGIKTDFMLSVQNPKKFFTMANKRHAKFAAYLAPEEYAKGEIAIKNMQTGEQKNHCLTELDRNFLP